MPKGLVYVYVAYAVVWVGILGFLLVLFFRLNGLWKELKGQRGKEE